jgi:hypothetical protein
MTPAGSNTAFIPGLEVASHHLMNGILYRVHQDARLVDHSVVHGLIE